MLYFISLIAMDYKKKISKKNKLHECYEEIDTRLASGWYVDYSVEISKKKNKTKEQKKNNLLKSSKYIISQLNNKLELF